jgi:peptidylprolyl isomerase
VVKKRLLLCLLAGAVVIAGCSSDSSSPDEVNVASSVGSWTVNNCSVIGPSTTVDTQPDGLGTADVLVINADGGAPSVAIAEAASQVIDLQVADIVIGSGDPVVAGDFLDVEYCGVGLTSRTVFDSSWARGSSAQFPLDGVIAGWQEGMPGMQAGGQRLLVIPGALAYGSNPPPGIEPDETLIFVVDLLERIGS